MPLVQRPGAQGCRLQPLIHGAGCSLWHMGLERLAGEPLADRAGLHVARERVLDAIGVVEDVVGGLVARAARDLPPRAGLDLPRGAQSCSADTQRSACSADMQR